MEPTQITIGRGQGITQALKQLVEEKAKQDPNVKISGGIFTKTEWANTIKVLDEIQANRKANNQASIFGKNYIVFENDKIEFTAEEMSKIYNAMGVEIQQPETSQKSSVLTATAAPPMDMQADVPQDKNTSEKKQELKPEIQIVETGLPTESVPHLETDKDGNRVNNYYDSNGKLIKSEPYKDTETQLQVQPKTLQPELESVETGLPTESVPHLETDKNGNRVNNYYDSNGKLIRSEPYKDTETQLQVQPKTLQPELESVETGLPTESIPHLETDKDGNRVNNYYDSNGKLIRSEPVRETTPVAKVSASTDEVAANENQNKPQQHTTDIEEYLKNDDNYQLHSEIYNTHRADFVRIGRQYNVKPGDFEDAKKKITNQEDLQAYINSVNTLYNERNSLAEYRKEMENWKDGPLNRRMLIRRSGEATGTGSDYTEVFRRNEFYVKHNNRVYTNVERITLKNGQHAWKSDQGVFYPWSNGKIGLDEVPAELL